MPPVVREPARTADRQAITLRMKTDDVGPSSDAFHPERWSNPPPVGLPPIVPFDEPEEDDAVIARALLERNQFAADAPVAAAAPAVPVERHAAEAQPFIVAEEPIVLPFRDREEGLGGRLLIRAAIVSATLIACLLAAVLLWS